MLGRVLVTGGAGFFGCHLVRLLGDRALCPRRSELDLLDQFAVQSYLESNRPSAIVHAAGFVGGIGLNKRHPARMAIDNLRMGLNVLETASKTGNIHVVLISTVCVYPAEAPIPITEDSIYDGYPAEDTAAYGLAKRELLSVAQALRAECDLDFSYVIPTNLYGPGDHFEESKLHVVPALIQRISEAKRLDTPWIEVWGDGTATRDLLYVEDAAQAIVDILRTGPHPFPINLGSGRETSIRELVEILKELTSYPGDIRWDTSRPSGAKRRLLDVARARQTFGYAPKTSLRDGLRMSIDWFEDQMEKIK